MRIRKPTIGQLPKETEKDYPPPTEAEAQAMLEAEQVRKEAKALERREKQLSKKWKEGTMTKQEEREFNRFGKDSNAMVEKLRQAADNIRKASTK